MLSKKNIPNLLTAFRGLATIVILLMFSINIPGKFAWILALFVLAAISDALDGNLARAWGAESDFGKVADSVLDKVLVLVTMILLVPYNLLPVWVYGLFVIRELVIDSMKNYFSSKQRPVTPSIYGKLKMLTESVLIGFLLLRLIEDGPRLISLTYSLAAVGLFLAYYSAFLYFRNWLPARK